MPSGYKVESIPKHIQQFQKDPDDLMVFQLHHYIIYTPKAIEALHVLRI